MPLLRARRFLPLFLTQFLGAFNDNLLKNALVMLITYRIAEQTGENAQFLVTLAAAVFILPYFLFSATAGQLADKYDRSKLTRIIKMVEIAIMLLAAAGFIFQHVSFLMIVLFGMGVHSTFFGPIKYALLPQHLNEHELLAGNGYIEAGTFLAILLGTIMGGVLILQDHGEVIVSAAMLVVALIGYISSRFIPEAQAPVPELRVDFNIARATWHIVAESRANRRVFACILGISWFWLVGATFLSQFPPYVKDALHADAAVVTLFLTLFSVGIGVGSFLCNLLLRGQIRSTYVRWAALMMGVFSADLYFASQLSFHASELMTLSQFISVVAHWRIMFDLFMIAVAGGLYIVPLYAIMQHDSDASQRARIIASNNIMNALFMVASAIGVLLLLAAHVTIPQLFLVMAALNILAAYLIRKV